MSLKKEICGEITFLLAQPPSLQHQHNRPSYPFIRLSISVLTPFITMVLVIRSSPSLRTAKFKFEISSILSLVDCTSKTKLRQVFFTSFQVILHFCTLSAPQKFTDATKPVKPCPTTHPLRFPLLHQKIFRALLWRCKRFCTRSRSNSQTQQSSQRGMGTQDRDSGVTT